MLHSITVKEYNYPANTDPVRPGKQINKDILEQSSESNECSNSSQSRDDMETKAESSKSSSDMKSDSDTSLQMEGATLKKRGGRFNTTENGIILAATYPEGKRLPGLMKTSLWQQKRDQAEFLVFQHFFYITLYYTTRHYITSCYIM